MQTESHLKWSLVKVLKSKANDSESVTEKKNSSFLTCRGDLRVIQSVKNHRGIVNSKNGDNAMACSVVMAVKNLTVCLHSIHV